MATLTEVLSETLDLVQAWGVREDEMNDWWTGTATGGPNNDGQYPMTSRTGVVRMFPCLARLAADMAGIRVLGSKANTGALPSTGNTAGDIWVVGTNGYVWSGSTWVNIGPIQGPAGTIAIGTVSTGAPGSSVVIANTGTSQAAVLDITIPKGDTGSTVVSINWSITTRPDPGEAFPSYLADTALTLSSARSRAVVSTAPVATKVFVLNKTTGGATTQIGTVTFGAGQTSGVIDLTSTAIAAGDLLTLVSPASQDANLTAPSITISANR